MHKGPVELGTLEPGYVVVPCSFHDAEIISVHQNMAQVEIVFCLKAPNFDDQKIKLVCEDVKFIYYCTGWFQNVVLDLMIFPDIENFETGKDLGRDRYNYDEALKILRTKHPYRDRPFPGLVLYCEPCAENELLVQCMSVSAEFVE